MAFALIVIPLSYTFTDVPGAIRFLFAYIPPMGIAFFLAVLWRRANRYGAFASFFVALAVLLYLQFYLGWGGDEGLPGTIMFYLGLGTFAGIAVSLLTPPEDAGRTDRFFLLLRTRIGDEQVLRDAGLVEIPGTGTFEDPCEDGSPIHAASARTTAGFPKPYPETVYGFLVVSAIALALIGLVKLIAWWLQYG